MIFVILVFPPFFYFTRRTERLLQKKAVTHNIVVLGIFFMYIHACILIAVLTDKIHTTWLALVVVADHFLYFVYEESRRREKKVIVE